MRLHFINFRLLFSIALLVWSCFSSYLIAQQENTPLLIFKQDTVSLGEFERVYAKNNGGPVQAKAHVDSQYREYLDLYIKFKRKVFEAEAEGLHETDAFKREFETYRKQLAQPYLSAQEVEEKLIKEAYDRSAYVVRASHLLLRCESGASPEDTLRIYKTAVAYRDSVVRGGKEFAVIAEKYSEDPSAKTNKGELGYFSVFDMVYPFESAAFSTKPGNVSEPIRTRFGYHLVKVHEKLNVPGKKRVSHILIRVGDRYSAKDTAQADNIMAGLYDRLKQGEDFAALAREYSDDPNSASKGGDLGTSRLLPEMEYWRYKLAPGEFSEPFNTRFGWHLMLVSEMDTLPAYDRARSRLRQRIMRDSRAQISQNALLNRIKAENGFTYSAEAVEALVPLLDELFPRGAWKADTTDEAKAIYQKSLFKLGDGYERSIQDFIDYYQQSRPRHPRMTITEAAQTTIDDYIERELLQHEENLLPEKNPDFKLLLQEYRDGILLFTLMEREVWKKAVEDTTGLRQYYDNHRDEFYANAMMDVKEYQGRDKKVVEEVAKLLKEGRTEEEIDSMYNRKSSLELRITTQTYEKEKESVEDEWFDQKVGYISEVNTLGSLYRVFVIQEKFPEGIKPFEKAKSESITKYQDYLEETWLAELENKYPVKINEKAFDNLFQ